MNHKANLKWQQSPPNRELIKGSQFYHWFTSSKSMTKRMEANCHTVVIKVLGSKWGYPNNAEREKLALKRKQKVLLREVLFICNNQPWLYGRIAMPRSALIGVLRRIPHLGTYSIGKILFRNKNLKRSPYEFAQVNLNSTMHSNLSQQLNLIFNEDLWARSSLFQINKAKIMLTEVMLPPMRLALSFDSIATREINFRQ